jgi:hypothetical protein
MALPKNTTKIVIPHPERVVQCPANKPGRWPGEPQATILARPGKESPNTPATFEGLANFGRAK